MKFLLAFAFLFASLNLFGAISTGFNPGIDGGSSGVLSASGAIAQTNVQRVFKIGFQVTTAPSGTVTAPTANLQVSNDCVHYTNAPLEATGDARVSGAIVGSGTFWFEKSDLSTNCVQMFYNFTGGGQINIQEVRKVHDALK